MEPNGPASSMSASLNLFIWQALLLIFSCSIGLLLCRCCGQEGLRGDLGPPEGDEVLPHGLWQNGWLEHSHGGNLCKPMTDFTKFFSSGCAPGAPADSPFCSQCAGSGKTVADEFKCKASAEEKYYGYAGAFRCLVDGSGDVAFIKHTTVQENSDGNGPAWARNLSSSDYELICPKKPSVPVTQFKDCYLAATPAHAVVTRPETRNDVVRVLQDEQKKFGRGSTTNFKLFESESGKNLLFEDSTKCLQEIPAGSSYEKFLGMGYMNTMKALRQCSDIPSDLEKLCTYSCQSN